MSVGSTTSAGEQDRAYERAVLAARAEPALRKVVSEAFLHEHPAEALAAFQASEHWGRVLRLFRAAGIAPPQRVLDLGGGRGLIAASLAQQGYEVVLCETNRSAVCGTGAAEDVRTAVGAPFAITSQPVARLVDEPAFDAVVCRAVLHHLDPLVEVLTDVRKILAPGGVFIATDEPTIRRHGDLERLRDRHPFVQFGVNETAYRRRAYLGALRSAGFVRTRSAFPVSLADYRRYERPELGAAPAVLRYVAYRVRSFVHPEPGAVRAFLARRDAA